MISLTRADRAARPRHAARGAAAARRRGPRAACGSAARCCSPSSSTTCCTSRSAASIPASRPARSTTTWCAGLRVPWVAGVYVAAAALLGLHLYHGLWAAARSLGVWPDGGANRRRPAVALVSAAVALGFASRAAGRAGGVAPMMPALDSRVPSGPLETQWERRRDELALVGPDAPALPHRAGDRRGAGRRLRGGHAVRAGLSRALPGLPRLAPARAQRGRAGRDQRRQELPERRRQRGAALPRDARGRRLPLARVERLPAGGAVRAHHRPRGGAGRALRARVRRPPRQPLLRRHAGLAHVLRARADRPAAPARAPTARWPRRKRRAASPCSRGARCSTSSWWTAGPAA